MRRPDLTDASILVLAAGGALVDPRDPGEARFGKEFVFSLALWALLGVVVREAVTSIAAAVSQRRRARALGRVDPSAVALDAVRQERERLSRELERSIRHSLQRIREALAALDRGEDTRAVASRIHHHAREATSELRRQLGLLRQAGPAEAAACVPPPRTSPLSRGTVALTIAAMVLTAVEAWAGPSLYGPQFYTSGAWRLPWSGLLGVGVAATLVGWRVAPVAAAAIAAGLLVIPREAGGVMVSSGFGMVTALGCLAWALARRGLRDPAAVAATLALAAATIGSRLRDDPLNAGFLAACLGVAWLAGGLVGASSRRRAAAEHRAGERQAELDATRDAAVHSARVAVARELHDVVSHAVGVIAMQAAAAQTSLPSDPATARRALETIGHVADEALIELDRSVPGATIVPDLDALVERIRATGTPVELIRRGPVNGDAVVYRIVQEGLTNAVRHAPGARVQVLVDAEPQAVRVRVADDGPGPRSFNGHGYGLIGLAERVQLQGGALRSGPGAGGRGFALEATLPRRVAP